MSEQTGWTSPSNPLAVASLRSKYVPPDWSQLPDPQSSFALEVFKNGVILERYDLSGKAFFLLGRQPEVCDLVLFHPSVSRLHAAIQHDGKGNLFLWDSGSTHGTTLNMSKVQGKQFVPIKAGDLLMFGFSSRLYLVAGPEEARSPDSQQILRDLQPETQIQVQMQIQSEKQRLSYVIEEDERDPYFDRTEIQKESSGSKIESSPKIETTDTLQKKASMLRETKKKLEATLQDLLRKTPISAPTDAQWDSLDQFMEEINQQKNTQEIKKVQHKLEEIEANLHQVQDYLGLIQSPAKIDLPHKRQESHPMQSILIAAKRKKASETKESPEESDKLDDKIQDFSSSDKKLDFTSPEKTQDVRSLNKARDPSEESDFDEGNADWEPPQNQCGDGKTPLNEKFGY